MLLDTFDQGDVDSLIEESIKMYRFNHVNVLNLLGVCLDSGRSPYIVLPYMKNGSLLNWLRRERSRIVLEKASSKDEVMRLSCDQSRRRYWSRDSHVTTLYRCVGGGPQEGVAVCMLSNCKGDAVLGWAEVHTQGSCCTQLHVRKIKQQKIVIILAIIFSN